MGSRVSGDGLNRSAKGTHESDGASPCSRTLSDWACSFSTISRHRSPAETAALLIGRSYSLLG